MGLVQHRTVQIANGATSVSLAFTSAAVVGNRSVAAVNCFGTTLPTFGSIADNGSPANSYNTDLNNPDATNNIRHEFASAQIANNPASGNLQITVSSMTNVGGGDLEIQEVSGLGTAANIVDTTGTVNGAATSNTATVTTSANAAAGEYCLGTFSIYQVVTGLAAGSGTTIDDQNAAGTGGAVVHKTNGAAGGATEHVDVAWTSPSSQYNGSIAAYKLAPPVTLVGGVGAPGAGGNALGAVWVT